MLKRGLAALVQECAESVNLRQVELYRFNRRRGYDIQNRFLHFQLVNCGANIPDVTDLEPLFGDAATHLNSRPERSLQVQELAMCGCRLRESQLSRLIKTTGVPALFSNAIGSSLFDQ